MLPLHVKGSQVVNSNGRPVILRGFCIGGWMNMENFINGYPGQEAEFRTAVKEVLGEGKARFFFDRMLDHFFNEDDIRFISQLGANVVRLPFNYRHFEDDMNPGKFKKEALVRLDRAVALCRQYGLYVILDLHSAQGWQNPDWHSDNPTTSSLLWTHKLFQDRAIALWEHLARHYRDESAVAGYNLVNEPVCYVKGALPAFYKRLIPAIRKIDRRHILFIEGNIFATVFTELSPDLDSNTVFSSHNYVPPGSAEGPYPGKTSMGFYNAAKIKKDVLGVTQFMRKHKVPCWVGEFGALHRGTKFDIYRDQVVDDEAGVFNEQGYHWTIWTYKDVGMMGTAVIPESSEWMRRTKKVRAMNAKMGLDLWGQRKTPLTKIIDELFIEAKKVIGKSDVNWKRVQWFMGRAVAGTTLSEALIKPFAMQFKGMSEKEIDRMMQSMALPNCLIRKDLAEVLRRRLNP